MLISSIIFISNKQLLDQKLKSILILAEIDPILISDADEF